MQITYQLTESDFIEAYSTHRNRNKLSTWIRRIFLLLLIALGVLLLLGLVLDHDAQVATDFLPFFVLGVMWLAIFTILPRWSVRKQFRKQPGAHGPRTASLDDAGTHWRWNGGASDVEWKNYIRCVEGTNQFLFYWSPVCFNILPKRALASDQLDEVRELVKQNIHT